MGELALNQKVEEKVLNQALEDPEEKDKALTELLSEENRQRIKNYFDLEHRPEIVELSPIYDLITKRLFQDIVIREGKAVPKGVIEPDEEDKKYLELYAALALFDQSLKNYRKSAAEINSRKSNIESKLNSAKYRLKRVMFKRERTREKLSELDNEAEINHEAIKLKSVIDGCDKEEKRIEKQESEYRKRLDSIDKELRRLSDESAVKCYYESVLSRAKELGLEETLNIEVPETKKETEIFLDANLLLKQIKRVSVEFIPYTAPKEPKASPGRWKKIIAIAAAIVLGSAVYGFARYFKEPEKDSFPKRERVEPPMPKRNYRRTTKPRRATPTTIKQSDLPEEYDKIPYKPASIWFPSKKYIPADIEIVSFDPIMKELELRYGEFEKTNKRILELTDEQLNDTFPDILLISYRKDGEGIYEVGTLYGLWKDGRWGKPQAPGMENPTERKVPKEEIMQYLRDIANGYKTTPLNEADIPMLGGKVIDAKYDNNRRLLTLFTTNKADIPIPLPDLFTQTDQDYDNIPEAYIEGANGHVYLDFSAEKGQVRCVEPTKNFNALLHFFPLPAVNLTPRFD